MDGDINSRVRRLHAAIGVAFDPKVEGYKPKVLVTDKVKVWQQDFRGGASEEEIQNDAFTLIGHIASFRDHLRKWAPTKQINKENVDNILFASPDYCMSRTSIIGKSMLATTAVVAGLRKSRV